MGIDKTRVNLQSLPILRNCLFQPLMFFQEGAIAIMGLGGLWHQTHSGFALRRRFLNAPELIPRDVHLPVPECTKRNDKNSRPFGAVQGPTRKKPFRRDISGATTDAERLSSGFFPYFPNEPVVIKMQEGGSGHHPGKYAFDYVDPDARLEIAQRPVGENQAHVKTNQRATAPEHETHKPADRAVCLDPFPIVNPNQREVLDIVKYFEQCDADENACHDVVAVPPKGNAGDEKHQLDRAW